MTKNQTIEILRLVRAGVTNEQELKQKAPFCNPPGELEYLLHAPDGPVLSEHDGILHINENGYNLLDEADAYDTLLQKQDEAIAIAKSASEKADMYAESNLRLSRIVMIITLASFIFSIYAHFCQ